MHVFFDTGVAILCAALWAPSWELYVCFIASVASVVPQRLQPFSDIHTHVWVPSWEFFGRFFCYVAIGVVRKTYIPSVWPSILMDSCGDLPTVSTWLGAVTVGYFSTSDLYVCDINASTFILQKATYLVSEWELHAVCCPRVTAP